MSQGATQPQETRDESEHNDTRHQGVTGDIEAHEREAAQAREREAAISRYLQACDTLEQKLAACAFFNACADDTVEADSEIHAMADAAPDLSPAARDRAWHSPQAVTDKSVPDPANPVARGIPERRAAGRRRDDRVHYVFSRNDNGDVMLNVGDMPLQCCAERGSALWHALVDLLHENADVRERLRAASEALGAPAPLRHRRAADRHTFERVS